MNSMAIFISGSLLFVTFTSTLGMFLDKKVGVVYNLIPIILASGYLLVSIFVVPDEPLWRNKPCLMETPTDHLIGFSSYRHKVIVDDYRQYRCY